MHLIDGWMLTQSRNSPDNLETVRKIQKLSGQSRKYPDNLDIEIYALYPESFCGENLAIRKVFAFSDSAPTLIFYLYCTWMYTVQCTGYADSTWTQLHCWGLVKPQPGTRAWAARIYIIHMHPVSTHAYPEVQALGYSCTPCTSVDMRALYRVSRGEGWWGETAAWEVAVTRLPWISLTLSHHPPDSASLSAT